MAVADHLQERLEPWGFVVVLPEPPGNNSTRKPGKRYRKDGTPYNGMVPTKEYKAWLDEAGHMLNRAETEVIPGRYAIDIVLIGEKGCDTDAVLKATNDLLVKHKLIKDDARKYQGHCGVDVWPELPGAGGFPIKPGQMQVRVRGLPDARG